MRRLLFPILAAALLLVRGASAQMPTNSLRLWLKADAITGLTNGDTVAVWPDSSGLGFDATQATAAARPYFVSNVLNGLPVVRFSRTNDYLMNLAYTNPAQDVTMIMVARRIGNKLAGSYQNIFIGGSPSYTTSAGNYFFQLHYELSGSANIGLNFYNNNLDVTSTNTAWSTNAFTLIGVVKSAAGSYSQFHVNGALRGSGSGAQTIGSAYYLGSWYSYDANFELAELAIYGNALPTNERQMAEGALAVKYGLQGQLPLDHPWRIGNDVGPAISTLDATNVGLTSACLNGDLSSTGTLVTAVSVVWGLANGGSVTSRLWQATNSWALGDWKNGDRPAFPVTGLQSNRTYYYRYAATNGAGLSEGATAWFITGYLDVQALDNAADEGPSNPALFTITRPATATNEALSVAYSLGGTAQEFKDYMLPQTTHAVTIPRGSATVTNAVLIVDDPTAEPAETVVLQPDLSGYFAAGGPSSSATVTIASNAAAKPAKTILYYRFEPGAGLQADSSGNGIYIATPLSATGQKSPAASGPSSAFPSRISDSGRLNSKCVSNLSGTAVFDAFETSVVFTVEAFASVTETNISLAWRPIAARWSSTAGRSWLFGVATNEYRLVFLVYAGSTSHLIRAPTSDFDVQTNKDYYLSVAVDGSKVGAGQRGVLFRMRNLTDKGPLLAGYADLPGPILDSTTPIEFGRYSSTLGKYDGFLDELRFSAGVLADDALMIEVPPVKSGTVILVR